MKDDFTLDNFLKAIGINQDFCLLQIFIDIYSIIKDSNRDIHKFLRCKKDINTIIHELENQYRYGSDVSLILKDYLKNNRKVYMGDFQDCESSIESYLSDEGITIHNEDIYFKSKVPC
jgi:hypothetical protein